MAFVFAVLLFISHMNAHEAAKGAPEGRTVIAIIPVILTTESIIKNINPRQNLYVFYNSTTNFHISFKYYLP